MWIDQWCCWWVGGIRFLQFASRNIAWNEGVCFLFYFGGIGKQQQFAERIMHSSFEGNYKLLWVNWKYTVSSKLCYKTDPTNSEVIFFLTCVWGIIHHHFTQLKIMVIILYNTAINLWGLLRWWWWWLEWGEGRRSLLSIIFWNKQ